MRQRKIFWLLLLLCSTTLFQCKDDDHDPEGPPDTESNAKSVTAFAFQALTPVATGTINEATKTITLTVPYGSNVTALVPTITISTAATISPASGVAQNFTNSVHYTVTAEDDSQQTYTVTVSIGERPIETCRPTLVGAIDAGAYLTITYGGEGNRIQEIVYSDSNRVVIGADDALIWTAAYEYTDNKPTRIEYTSDLELSITVTTLEYSEDEIIETHDDGLAIHYHLEDGRITTFEYFVNGNTSSWGELIYNEQGNITRMNNYLSSDGSLESYEIYQYDDKPNIYAKTGAAASLYMFFNQMNLSANNMTQVSYYFAGEEDVSPTMTFTYDEYDRPLTRSGFLHDNRVIRYEYECP